MTPRDAKRKLPAERRSELLGRAVEIARAEGLSAVTLRRVAADLGVTPGLVSHYFSAAEHLTAAAFRAAAQQDLDAAGARVAAQTTATAKMQALIDYVLDDDGDEGSALWLETWTLTRRNPVLAGEADELTGRWVTLLADIVGAGVAAGEFTVAGPVDAVARRLLTLIDGLGSQKVVRSVPAAEAKQIARTYLGSELAGVTSPR